MTTVLHGLLGLVDAVLWLNAWSEWRERSTGTRSRWPRERRQPSDADAGTLRAAVDLHAIHNRFEVASLRNEIQRESTRVRRLMAMELDDRQ
jgi:hypothetical protein